MPQNPSNIKRVWLFISASRTEISTPWCHETLTETIGTQHANITSTNNEDNKNIIFNMCVNSNQNIVLYAWFRLMEPRTSVELSD